MDNRFLTSSSSSSSTSSSDEDLPYRRPRIVLERRNPITQYDDVDFKIRFRLSRRCVEEVLNLIGNHLGHLSNRNKPISPMNQLLIALRFYATGSFQICMGDNFHISKATVCRVVQKVTLHIAMLRQQFVRMPQNANELIQVQNGFYEMSGFPRVVGAIDCTHIRIQSPGGDHGEIYRNRKGWFYINVQVTCDARQIIRDVVARWPGSVHDATIFNDSLIRARFENNEYPGTYLLGDNGYGCRKYLLTPLLNPQTRSEQAYNTAHIRTRNVIERTFGVLKRRFPCLSLGLRLKIETVLGIIVASTILHNIATELADDEPNEDPNIVFPLFEDAANIDHLENDNNMSVRTALINTVFAR